MTDYRKCDLPSDVDRMDIDDERLSASPPPRDRTSEEMVPQQSSAVCLPHSNVISPVNSLATTLLRQNAILFFTVNSQNAHACWASLSKETRLSPSTNSSDPAIVTSFQRLDNIITSKESSLIMSRFAYVRLMQLFDTIEEIINSSRQQGLIHRAAGYRNASIALDIYMSTQEGYASSGHRRQLLERKRTGRRWRQLAGPSPLFLLVYSDKTERVVCVTLTYPPMKTYVDKQKGKTTHYSVIRSCKRWLHTYKNMRQKA